MGERLTGTVTFLFTDIEGSTRLLAELGPDRYRIALEDHRRIVRAAVGQHGTEMGTEGDSFLVAFSRASDAVRAAEQAQRDLASASWPADTPVRVRMGIHTAEVMGDGDYVGIGVHRGARIAAAGHGGQVLLSQATADLLTDERETVLRDLGEHRLKDFDEPQHIYQLQLPGLPDAFPPLRAASVQLTNLASQLTSFIGRERELAELRALAERHRLVTLIGVGGTGKTRLMVEAGAPEPARFRDGVWLVELAPLGDPELVSSQVARSLRLPEEPGRKPIETLLDFLRPKSALILLDNCEHLIGAAGQLAVEVLRHSPRSAILASSREALGVSGEVVFQVPSLGVPAKDSDRPFEEVAASESVRLFVER